MSNKQNIHSRGVYYSEKKKVGNLYNLRQEKGLTQDELCLALNFTRTAYNSWENGSTKIKSDVLEMLADYYDVSVDYLLGRSECRNVNNDYINKKTGLSDTAINTLSKWNISDDRRILWSSYLNHIICHVKSEELLSNISNLAAAAKIEGLSASRNYYNDMLQSIDNQVAQLWYISHSFTSILEDLTKEIRSKNYKKK